MPVTTRLSWNNVLAKIAAQRPLPEPLAQLTPLQRSFVLYIAGEPKGRWTLRQFAREHGRSEDYISQLYRGVRGKGKIEAARSWLQARKDEALREALRVRPQTLGQG